jgi:hypothetical protein
VNWQDYEKFVYNNVSENYPDAKLEYNSSLIGKYSKNMRQCDIIIREQVKGVEYVTLVDAKYYNKKIDVKAVESFISMAKDVNADKGVLVTPIGYSKSAYNRAEYDDSTILLDILTLDELKKYQGYCAIPYAGEFGMFLGSAFGWIIDATQRYGMIATSYRVGLDFDQALNEKEFVYFQFWDKKKEPLSALKLFENQVELISESSGILYSKIEKIKSNSKNLILRKTIAEKYLAVEYACAIEYDDYIFYGVLISPENRETVNKKKLIQMIERAKPVRIKLKN